ncbi:hypothetical protein C2869_11505 [Saccharobesus litoralis]|uniref:Poly A polymerase head domain-containing protein n=1 Tax=Saccharobesus litoralis TaxID=2172099 RepID=A0A2S0VS33_9ALTE|nr:hypothetical protein [Saccharobesus litoralis]AWB67026.1 hypothetical protein C2869_11505 [Saccharobesus litoralis]
MAKTAVNRTALTQRLRRFFYSHNTGRRQVSEITNQLLDIGKVYLFGGAIRDIALEGVRNFYSDLDFVVDCVPSDLDTLMQHLSKTYPVTKNKFGGYRLLCSKWWLDIWALSNTWAFKQGVVKLESPQSLLNTTILNWDAIIFDMQTEQLGYKNGYFQQLQQGLLDINLVSNPNPIGAYVRVLRCLANKKVDSLSLSLRHYLNANNYLTHDELIKYEIQHFSSCYLQEFNWQALEQTQKNNQSTPVKWLGSEKNLPLLIDDQ